MSVLKRFLAEETGATAIEYALLTSLIVAILSNLGTTMSGEFSEISAALK
jgi:Flp pilus assembly pilin Flp